MGITLKRTIIYLLTVFTVFLFSGCEEKDDQSRQKQSPKAEHIKLALGMQPSSGLIMVAHQKGLFRKYGIELEIIEFPSGKRALHGGLFTGDAHIAVSTEVPIVISMIKNKEFSIIATTFSADNVNRVIARKSAGINSPSDLKGKNIATQKGSAVHFFLHLFLMEQGFSSKDINDSYMKAEMLPKALASKQIDAFSMREPYISRAKELLGEDHIIFAAPGVYRQLEAVVINKKLLNKPDTIKRFLKALIEAEEYINKNPEDAKNIIAHKLKVSKDSIDKIWPQVSLKVTLNQSSILIMEDISRWAINEKLTTEKKVPNTLEYIYSKGLKSLKPQAVDIIK